MASKLLVIHGGGPTCVLNASLYGAIREAQRHRDAISGVYGCMGGAAGLFGGDIRRMDDLPDAQLELLKCTPGTVIGTSRYPLTAEDYPRMAQWLKQNGFGYVLMSGGNGTMDTCGRLDAACRPLGVRVNGIPKTIDNDISHTDHSPGFGSAARFIAGATRAIGEDVRSLPIHVCIIEAMGRNAGWIAASSALARRQPGDAPHLIYLPERPFDQEAFLRDVEMWHKRLGGGVVVVASEGLKNKDGTPVVAPIFRSDRAVYYGDVGTHLAMLVIKHLGIKARSEKPGLLGRAQMELQSPLDRDEAAEAGAEAVRALVEGHSGIMPAFERLSTSPYRMRLTRVPLEQVTLRERVLPDEYINEAGNDVTDAFVQWARPLAGEALPAFFGW